jgi:hypothetical protein
MYWTPFNNSRTPRKRRPYLGYCQGKKTLNTSLRRPATGHSTFHPNARTAQRAIPANSKIEGKIIFEHFTDSTF